MAAAAAQTRGGDGWTAALLATPRPPRKPPRSGSQGPPNETRLLPGPRTRAASASGRHFGEPRAAPAAPGPDPPHFAPGSCTPMTRAAVRRYWGDHRSSGRSPGAAASAGAGPDPFVTVEAGRGARTGVERGSHGGEDTTSVSGVGGRNASASANAKTAPKWGRPQFGHTRRIRTSLESSPLGVCLA